MTEGPVSDSALDLWSELNDHSTAAKILDSPKIQDTILRRLWLLTDVYQKQFGDWQNIELNEYVLRESVESCLCDLYRLKAFRGITQEDEHKQAAFLVKWITKFRPIQFRNTAFDKESIVLVNELFAVYVALVVLNLDPKNCCPHWQYIRNFLYLLHYHSCSAEQIASEMYLLEQLCRR